MSRSYANILADILQQAQDTGAATYASAETTIAIREALQETARFAPNVVIEPFTIEGRTGTASSTSSGNLVDATNSQFLSTDTDKVIYNTTDKTWAVVTSYSSATTIGLNRDIMASGEAYIMLNKRCTNNKQINISDVDDYQWITRLEYPVNTRRNYDIEGDILTVDINSVNDTNETDADKDVYIWFAKNNKLSQLTDLSGTIASESEGDTSIAIAGLQATGTIEKGQEFTISGCRFTYRATADATISTNAATVSIFPALEAALTTATCTFKQSTLKAWFEPPFCLYCAGKLQASKAGLYYLQVKSSVDSLSTASTSIGVVSDRLTQALTDINDGRTEVAKISAVIDEAGTEIDKMVFQITQAVNDITEGRTSIGDYTPKADQFADYGRTDLAIANGNLTDASGFLREAQARGDNNAEYLRQANTQIQSANTSLGQANSYIKKASTELSTSNAARNLESAGRAKMAEAIRQMEALVKTHPAKEYSRG